MKYKRTSCGGKGHPRATQHRWRRENQTSDESEDDCDPSVADSPVRMSCQIFADVDESKDDLDLSDRPELSTLQVLSHVGQKTTDYQEESSDDGGEDIQHDKDITDNEVMEKRPSNERLVQPKVPRIGDHCGPILLFNLRRIT
ncbi:hypothetical protein SRHO_G00209740 [Serrasalmus rhombeus]